MKTIMSDGTVLFEESDLEPFMSHGEFDEEAFLAHHGVKGMKWGVRRGKGVTGVNRFRSATIDRNDRLVSAKEKYISGEKGRRQMALGNKIFGEGSMQKMLQTHVNELNAQSERLKSGKVTIADKVDMATSVSLFDLAVSRRPK